MSRDRLFIDTGAWIALANTGDQYHRAASDYYRSLHYSVERVTSTHVLSETYTWLRYKAGFQHAQQFLAVMGQARTNRSVRLVADEPGILENAEQLLLAFPDQRLSYTDAVSMAIMHDYEIHKAFTFDRHFYLKGFEVVP